MACLMLFARRLPTTIFSQLTVSEALRLLGQTFIAINTKFFPAVVRPANFSRIPPEPSWSLEGTWATFATSNTRVFRLDWSTLALGTCGSSIQFSKKWIFLEYCLQLSVTKQHESFLPRNSRWSRSFLAVFSARWRTRWWSWTPASSILQQMAWLAT